LASIGGLCGNEVIKFFGVFTVFYSLFERKTL